jgi:ParB family chromosome partitioning protein
MAAGERRGTPQAQRRSGSYGRRSAVFRRPRIRTPHQGESTAKLLSAFLRKAEEGVIGKLIVETVILLSASKQADGGKILRTAAQAYKVDTDAIALKVKHEFTAKEKARSAAKIEPKSVPKALKKAKAA